jgi:hypothetical protein
MIIDLRGNVTLRHSVPGIVRRIITIPGAPFQNLKRHTVFQFPPRRANGELWKFVSSAAA